MKKITRRNFLKKVGLLTVSTSIPSFFVTPVFGKGDTNTQKFCRTLPLMNTYVTITVYDNSRYRAQEAMDKAFSKMKALINIFNRFDKNSHVSWLNQNKRLTDVPEELLNVLMRAKSITKLSNGKFDITVLPLLEIIEYEYKIHGHFPEPKLIKEVLPYVGWKNISISKRKIELSSQSKITLDGIAKGYIVDQGAEILKKSNIKHALIDAGGDIKTIGGKDRLQGWKIGVEDPTGRKRCITTVRLSNMAIATSGNYRNFFDQSKRVFHIIDKKGSMSPQRTISCSVIAKNACIADGLATGLFALAPEEATEVANNLNIPIFVVTHGNRTFSSNTWRYFTG